MNLAIRIKKAREYVSNAKACLKGIDNRITPQLDDVCFYIEAALTELEGKKDEPEAS